jgi:polyhydroxybutyrate depolymerase
MMTAVGTTGRLAALGLTIVALASCASAAAPDGQAGPAAASSPATTAVPARPGARPSPGCDGPPATGPRPPVTSTTGASGPTSMSIDVDGETRTFELDAPAPGDDRPAPLVFAFHGFGETGASFDAYTRIGAKGSAGGSFVVTPDGKDKDWDKTPTGADGRFVDAMIAELGRQHCIDTARIYATGYSAGAAFATFYACSRPDTIAAIATVAVEFQLGCRRPMPIVDFHGTADPAVPYQDGAVGLSLHGVKVRGTENNMGDWATLDGCAATPTTTPIGSEVTELAWSGCTGDAEATLYRVEGGGHTWPGGDPSLVAAGLTTQQVDATDLALQLFARHHQPTG